MEESGLRTMLGTFKMRENNIYFLPANILGIIIGPSMSGKTTYLLNLLINHLDQKGRIIRPSVLNPDKIILFAPTKSQPLYQNFLAMKEKCPTFCADVEAYSDLSKLPKHKELDEGRKCVIIDDSIAMKDQDKFIDYFTQGRHSNCDTFYVTQDYFKVPPIIRGQLNLIIDFGSNKPKVVEDIYGRVDTELDLKEFKKWYRTLKHVQDSEGLVKRVPKVLVFGVMDPGANEVKMLRDGILPVALPLD